MRRLGPAALFLCLVFAGCQSVRSPDTFVFGAMSEVTSLDPVYPYDAVSQGVIFNVYETLIAFERDRNDAFIPLLSEKVPTLENGLVSKDGRSYTFPIRKGVKFHDGKTMTPEDVRYSLMRFMLTDRSGGPSSLLLEPILGRTSTRDSEGKITVDFKDVEKAVRVDGDNVVVTLKTPFGPFLSIMARWSYVMDRDWAAANGEWNGLAETWKKHNNPDKESGHFFSNMNGTGPFMLESWDRTVKRVILKRNESYWREPAKLRRVVVASISEFSTRKLMLRAGDADIIDVSRSLISQVKGLKGVRVADGLPRLLTDPAFFFTFDINTQGNPDIGSGKLDGDGIPPDFFQDLDIRKGFAYAFDYDAYIEETFKGRAHRSKGVVPPGLPGHHPDLPFYRYDKDKAVAHLKKARGGEVWEKGFRFTLTYNTGGDVREYACQILKRNVELLNPRFRVDLRGLDWAAYLDRAQKRQMPLFSRGWTADYPDAHNFAFPFYHRRGRYATAQAYVNPLLTKLVDRAAREVDPVKRSEIYKAIQIMGYEDVPQILTVHPQGVYAMRDWVRGFYDNAVFMGPYFYPLSKGEAS